MEFNKEEQEIIYSALFYYQQHVECVSNSNQALNEEFHHISDKTMALMRRLYESESWQSLII